MTNHTNPSRNQRFDLEAAAMLFAPTADVTCPICGQRKHPRNEACYSCVVWMNKNGMTTLEVLAYLAALDEPRNPAYPASPFYQPETPMLETIQVRQERLEKELADPISKERADAILNELAEIETWFEREMIFNHGEVYEQARRFHNPL